MVGNTQVSYTICLNTMNNDNLTRHEKAIHNPLVTGTIEYHSTVDVPALKNDVIYICKNEINVLALTICFIYSLHKSCKHHMF